MAMMIAARISRVPTTTRQTPTVSTLESHPSSPTLPGPGTSGISVDKNVQEGSVHYAYTRTHTHRGGEEVVLFVAGTTVGRSTREVLGLPVASVGCRNMHVHELGVSAHCMHS